MYSYSLNATFLLIGYIILNAMYSLYLKHIAIIDITCIAIGFIIRILIGGVIVNIILSKWIIIMTFLLALFIGLGKRKGEFLFFEKSTEKARQSMDGYNIEFIDKALSIMGAVLIVCYMMYVTETDIMNQYQSEWIFMTSIFVIVGILRYLQLISVYRLIDSPTKIIYTDYFLQIVLILWVTSFGIILYIK